MTRIALELDVEVVRHGQGPLSEWAETAKIGDRAAVSGTGRGYEVDADVRDFLLAGDESALPAIGVLLAALPQRAHVQVIVELRDPSGRVGLAEHPGAVPILSSYHWGWRQPRRRVLFFGPRKAP